MPPSYSLQTIAETIGGDAFGDKEKRLDGVAPFDTADASQVTFASGKKFLKQIDACRAGAIIVPKGFEASGKNLIGVSNPQLAFAQVVLLYHPTASPPAGIDDTARVGSDVRIGDGAFVGAFATIGDRVSIGSEAILQNGVFIGNDVTIGDQAVIHPNVTVMNGCRIGNRVTIHPGTVIGSDGYGFVPEDGRYYKIPQIGIVQIDDDVEIGACTAIDRATFGKTWIQRGVKIDNLVHIAHNVTVGEDSVIVAQVGIAGSTELGHHVILAGQAGISGHLSIGNHATVGPKTGVAQSIPDGQVVSSANAAMPHRTWLRVQQIIPTLPDLKKKFASLEKSIAKIKSIIENV